MIMQTAKLAFNYLLEVFTTTSVRRLVYCGFYCFTTNTWAMGVPDLQVMLNNVASTVPSLMKLVTGGAYIAGMFLTVTSLVKMRHLGEMRTMASKEHSIVPLLMQLFIGSALMFLVSTSQIFMQTLWGYPSPLSYVDNSGNFGMMQQSCVSIIQLIGTIAFIRGLFQLNSLTTDRGGGQNSLSKALTHLVGGALCINIQGTIRTLEATVGML